MREVIRTLISAKEIELKVKEIAGLITRDYEKLLGFNESEQPDGMTKLILVCILKGGVMFMVDLARQIPLPVAFEFMDISSYGMNSVSSGIVKIERDLDAAITDQHVILMEDIIDTGHTLNHLKNHLMAQHPASLKICALLDKQTRREVDINADYIGFVIPDYFVVGYGLDYAQRHRNLPYVGILEFKED
ncbi:MAG: hypoxanthine phosphoribosyltransferase [Clostridiales bacterium]|nr:hypoxanthine phosphoribosyltransferase [Clostridiales bacterium]